MIIRLKAAAIAASALGLLLLPVREARGEEALRVLVSNGMKAAIEELQPKLESAAGGPVVLKFNSSAGIRKQIEAGEEFDLTLITSEAIDDLIRQGKLSGDPKANLVRSELGIGIRKGAPRPDIRTIEALKQTLLATKSITYPQDGAGRGYVEKMFERMGIAAKVQPKIILAPSSGASTHSIAAGKAEMVITLYSEIVPVPGVEIVGPLPGEFQYHIRFSGAVSAKSKHADAAKAVLSYLAGPSAMASLKAKGLDAY
jgi:molybdate transport system substrate-binding protein